MMIQTHVQRSIGAYLLATSVTLMAQSALSADAPGKSTESAASAKATGGATEYVIDPDHSSVDFKIAHAGKGLVPGSFLKYEGAFTFDDKDFAKTKLRATADAASIFTKVEKRDQHLRSKDFFDVEKFPKIAFISTSATKTGNNTFKLAGDFTMHGVTRPVTFDVTFIEKAMTFGKEHVRFEGKTKINRKEFDMNFSVADSSIVNAVLPTPLVGDIVEIEITADGVKK